MTAFTIFYVIPSAILLVLFLIGLYVHRNSDKVDGTLAPLAIIFIPFVNIIVLAFVLDSLVTTAFRVVRSK